MRKYITIILFTLLVVIASTGCTPCQVQAYLDSFQPDAPPAADTLAGCDDPVNAQMDYCINP